MEPRLKADSVAYSILLGIDFDDFVEAIVSRYQLSIEVSPYQIEDGDG
jgi:hypothetical protein